MERGGAGELVKEGEEEGGVVGEVEGGVC